MGQGANAWNGLGLMELHVGWILLLIRWAGAGKRAERFLQLGGLVRTRVAGGCWVGQAEAGAECRPGWLESWVTGFLGNGPG